MAESDRLLIESERQRYAARQEVERVTRERDEARAWWRKSRTDRLAAEYALAAERERAKGLRGKLEALAAECDTPSPLPPGHVCEPPGRVFARQLRALLSTPEPQDTQNQEDDHV